ncbi:MAG: ATP-dependent DNA helicase RecG [Patescibacteria group bacterium]|nr:ATP-dependent DNA helicase RecG [bacterium]MDZ4240923.1 ATP-dependent DNA helicase RecG [Patescibacteria group bacterium]
MNLFSPIETEFRLLPPQKKALKKLGIETIQDLLFYFPVRYGDTAQGKIIKDLVAGDSALVYGKILQISLRKGFKSKIPMAEAKIEDGTGSVKAVWFHQPYIAKIIHEGAFVKIEGKVSDRKGALYFSNPEIEEVQTVPTIVGDSLFGKSENGTLYPVYRESRGISSRWFFHSIRKVFESGILKEIEDPIPEDILKKYHLPTLTTALVWIHSPRKENDSLAARKRFAFEEVFFIQLQKQRDKKEYEHYAGFPISKSGNDVRSFVKRLPFSLTNAQEKAVENIFSDFKKDTPMSRLLEGDVGSGKTAVAAITSYAVATTTPHNQDYGNLQVAYMAPTEILAEQHFNSFIELFSHLPLSIGLITGSGCKKFPSKVNPKKPTDISRTQLSKWVKNGEIAMVIGTHTLIQKSVEFKNLAFVIIDEQHRFGTMQRKNLRHKKDMVLPHLLSMTATPIPRTLALTIYGDLDLTLLDENPPGRKPIQTEIVLPGKRDTAYEKVREEIGHGRQAYIICPRIDEPDPTKEMAVIAKSVTEEAKRLKKEVFKKESIAVLHGKMTKIEKESVMRDFKDGKTDILIATSVVEVGVNVPNATVILIEGAERFGLAQLHQLRGRVLRSTHQAYCFVFTENRSKGTFERLQALLKARNGFELAELDLAQRGSGELSGRKQWGLSDLGMEAIRNMKMVEAARNEASSIIDTDPVLIAHPLLKKRVENSEQKIHFE